jgi:D-alanyl-D-alanine carboxypeptidase (penicillin-binding protein 5/6)
MDMSTELVAPVMRGAVVGAVRVSLAEESVIDVPLVVLEDVPEAGFVGRIKDALLLWWQS